MNDIRFPADIIGYFHAHKPHFLTEQESHTFRINRGQTTFLDSEYDELSCQKIMTSMAALAGYSLRPSFTRALPGCSSLCP
jgi:hypothetical protein